nr:Chain A, Major prion protein [Homo sapiens]
EYNNQNNFV